MALTKKQIIERIEDSLWGTIEADKANDAVELGTANVFQVEEVERIRRIINEWKQTPANEVKAEAASVFGWV